MYLLHLAVEVDQELEEGLVAAEAESNLHGGGWAEPGQVSERW